MDVNLVLFKKGGGGRSFIMPSMRVLIGRSADCHFRIPVMSVSRRHCELFIEDGKLYMHDLDSRNGTFVNGVRMENSVLRAGDFIRIGPVLFGIQIDGIPGRLVPSDFVVTEESQDEELPDEDSTIVQTPRQGQTQTPSCDTADDVLMWFDENEEKEKQSSEGGGQTG